jgi:hypothetical protein
MNAARVARSTGLTLATVILAVSGIYVVVDLARWEWNRAVISALVMIAALVVLVAMVLSRQLHRIEQRLEALERSRHDDAQTLTTVRETNGRSAIRHFRWLERPTDRVGVFIPVLLGAGVLVSLLAYLLERVAGVLAAATLDPRTARHLSTDLPLGSGLPHTRLDPLTRATSRRRTSTVAVLVVALLVSAVSVIVLRELTQTRPKEITAAGTTTILLDIDQRRQFRPLPTVTEDLWGACRSRLPGDIQLVSIDQLNDEQVQIQLDRALGDTGRVRIVGCFEDHTLDLVRGDVLQIESHPATTSS